MGHHHHRRAWSRDPGRRNPSSTPRRRASASASRSSLSWHQTAAVDRLELDGRRGRVVRLRRSGTQTVPTAPDGSRTRSPSGPAARRLAEASIHPEQPVGDHNLLTPGDNARQVELQAAADAPDGPVGVPVGGDGEHRREQAEKGIDPGEVLVEGEGHLVAGGCHLVADEGRRRRVGHRRLELEAASADHHAARHRRERAGRPRVERQVGYLARVVERSEVSRFAPDRLEEFDELIADALNNPAPVQKAEQ